MKLQELVNKLSNMLASGAGEAEVKIGDTSIEAVIFDEKDGVKVVTIAVAK